MPRLYDDYALELWLARRGEEFAKGFAEGMEENRRVAATMVLGWLRHSVGTVPETLAARVEPLPFERLEQLAGDLLDFSGPADLERWLDRH